MSNNKKPLIYQAGRMFSKAEITGRMVEADILDKVVGDRAITFSPVRDNPANDKSDESNLPTSADIFDGDLKKVLLAKYILFEVDGEDPGAMAEGGIAYGVNAILVMLWDMIDNITTTNREEYYKEVERGLRKILEEIPIKKFFSHATDIRIEHAGKYETIKVPFGLNQFCIEMLLRMGGIYPDYNSLFSALSKELGGGEVRVDSTIKTAVEEIPRDS